jgi:methylthioribose-1-phosphate isomerase
MRNAIEWCDDHLEVIDQTVLPARLDVVKLATVDDVVDAIKRLVVRGAPAIGVCGAFGVVMGLREGRSPDELRHAIGGARPTAVNLRREVDRVLAADDALTEALKIQAEDRESCARIGEYGRVELASVRRVLTHCNTGRLATSGIGTALGIVYAKFEAGEPIEVIATETRPLLQGGRLTAWELHDAGIPVTLIGDSAAGAALVAGKADAVIVGCDRVAANGDTANKIGTYQLAVLARAANVPFYVAGPMSSFDLSTPDGRSIEIEFRPAVEVTAASGADVDAWNPAFDVTPAHLITAFITDLGVLRPPFAVTIAAAVAAQS